MGMYDRVECRYPLPDPRLRDAEFQTKDLECLLQTYTITEDGRLMLRAPKSGRRGKLARDVEWPIHGDVRIYTSDPDRERGLVDLVVRFTHGRVESIRRLKEGEDPRGAPPPHPWEIDTSRLDSLVGKRSKTEEISEQAGPITTDDDRPEERQLLENLRAHRAELARLLEELGSHWGFEDPIYRFYHQSFKVFGLQATTERIVERLRALAPGRELNPWFVEIVQRGTGLSFESEHNARWLEVTRPIVEGFFHARYFLEMAVRYGSLKKPPSPLPSGYAALLYLYGLR